MTENEKELMHIISQTDNPEKSIKIAIGLILDFLKQHESSPAPSSACLQELG